MKAMVLHGHGGLEMLRWHEDWPCPVPAAGVSALVPVAQQHRYQHPHRVVFEIGQEGSALPEGPAALTNFVPRRPAGFAGHYLPADTGCGYGRQHRRRR